MWWCRYARQVDIISEDEVGKLIYNEFWRHVLKHEARKRYKKSTKVDSNNTSHINPIYRVFLELCSLVL